MYLIRPPDPSLVARHLAEQSRLEVYQTMPDVADPPPRGWTPNRGGEPLGTGEATFDAAREAVRHWEMFPGDWVWVEPLGTPVERGQTVGVVARCLGLWTLNCCRIVDVTETPREFAFTYATTSDHAISGAERFSVTWGDDDHVRYCVYSIARPRDLRVWLAYPWFRQVQRRFAVESPRALQRAIERRLEGRSAAASETVP